MLNDVAVVCRSRVIAAGCSTVVRAIAAPFPGAAAPLAVDFDIGVVAN